MKKFIIYIFAGLGLFLAAIGAFFMVRSLNYNDSGETSFDRVKDVDVVGFVKKKAEEEEPEEEVVELKPHELLSVEEAPWLDAVIGKPVKYSREEALAIIEERAALDERYEVVFASAEELTTGLLVDVVNNPEMADFLAGFFDADARVKCELTEEEKAAKLPHYLQWDERWGYESYGTSCIAESGCGPTTLAMVVSGLTEEKVTPADMAKYAMEKGYYVKGSGTSWGLMGRGAKNFGLVSRNVSFSYLTEDYVKSWLDDGAYLILSVKPGDFTVGGHFLVVRDYDDEGFYVNDPFCRYKSTIPWEWKVLRGQSKGAFLVSRAETVVTNEPVDMEEPDEETIEPDEVPSATISASPSPSVTPSPTPTPTPEPDDGSDDYDDPANYIAPDSVEEDYPE